MDRLTPAGYVDDSGRPSDREPHTTDPERLKQLLESHSAVVAMRLRRRRPHPFGLGDDEGEQQQW